MRRRGWILVLVAVLGALLPVAAHAAAAPLSLRGTNWVLRGSASVNAVFDGARVQGENACNTYRAPYTARGARLRIGPDVSTTKVACPDAVPDYESRLVQVASFHIRGITLTLRDRAGRRLLSYRASIGKSALHGGWSATSYYTGSAVRSVEPGSTLTLEFADARVSGDGGCNTFDGGYRVQGVDRIHIGSLAATLRACADPALNDQETRYLAALQLAVRYRVTGSSLTLYRPGGTIAATFERATGLTSGS